MTTRPSALVAVVGTATEIGKTWVSARLLETWRTRDLRVAARKPAQSFEPGDDTRGVTDADVLGAASGEATEVVCTPGRSYPVPLAPPMAARSLGRPAVQVGDLLDELRWPAPAVDVGLVETAGGLRSPLAEDADVLSFVGELHPDLALLVADAGLGTINAVRLCVDALMDQVRSYVVVLNRYDVADPLHRANLEWLQRRDGFDVVAGTPDGLASVASRVTAAATAR